MTNTLTKEKPVETNAKSAVLQILRLIEDFGNLLVKETEALKKADFRYVDLLQNDKKNFAKSYHAAVGALAENKSEIEKLDAALRERLIKARTTFTIILSENLRALETSRESTRRLVDRILDTARRSVVNECQQAIRQAPKRRLINLPRNR